VKRSAALTVLLAVLALAAQAQAATLTLTGTPPKACYRAGDVLTITGSGFTPGQPVSFTLDNQQLTGQLTADAAGNISSPFTVGLLRGIRTRTLVATDAFNPANVGSAIFLGSALQVTVRPKNGAAGRRLRINASGFTTGKRLYAHVLRKRYRRNVFIGKLKGPCRKLSKRRQVLSGALPSGRYTVQFDTKRKYSRKTKVRVRFKVTVTAG
jgi:hypothetical protein